MGRQSYPIHFSIRGQNWQPVGQIQYLETEHAYSVCHNLPFLHLLLSLISIPCGRVKAFEFAAFISRPILGFSLR